MFLFSGAVGKPLIYFFLRDQLQTTTRWRGARVSWRPETTSGCWSASSPSATDTRGCSVHFETCWLQIKYTPTSFYHHVSWEVINLTALWVLDIPLLTVVYYSLATLMYLLVFNAARTFTSIYELLKVSSVTVCVEPVWHFLYKTSLYRKCPSSLSPN